MSEYIFFDAGLRDRFLTFVAEHGIPGDSRPDAIDGFLVILPETLPDELAQVVEEQYERLMDEQQQLVESEDDEDRTVMGIDVTLPDGRSCLVRLQPLFARRLCDHFSGEEIRALVAEIAASVLAPAKGPLCCER
jgi:hypothetical protein